ncbi:MAG: aspartate-semialdehyde dehydrogenase [Sphaerochaeta sp.]
MEKLKVGILGATGMVGQRFVTLLAQHPWFSIEVLAASPKSAGKTYARSVEEKWMIAEPLPESVRDMVVADVSDVRAVASGVDFVFSAVDMKKDEIKAIEEEYAKAETPVVSNNSAHRWTGDVPMVIPEINADHYKIIDAQRRRLGTKRGFIAVKPNCSIQSYTPALAAWSEFEPYEVIVSTYQAISGAGKNFESWPEMTGNIIPFISGEEEKSEKEPMKVFGRISGNEIVPFEGMKITSQCIRVPVLNGHTTTVFVKFRKKVSKDVLIEKLRSFRGLPQEYNLPSAPKHFIQYLEDENRPQIALDVDYENGMGISVGRLREDSIYDFKFVGLSHNTLRGAAGGGVEAAEMLYKLGYLNEKN